MKGVLKAVGALVILAITGSVIAEDQSTMVSNGITIVIQQIQIPIPGGGGTTANWGGPGSGNAPCLSC